MEEPQDLPEQPVSTFEKAKIEHWWSPKCSVELLWLRMENKAYSEYIYLEVKSHCALSKLSVQYILLQFYRQ